MIVFDSPKQTACALMVACVALATTAAAAQAPPSQSLIAEGAGGRTALTRWTLREDTANRGLALGWQRGTFGGGEVSVPNVVNPQPISGPAAQRNYEGSVAWYRTSFQAPAAGTYALSFSSANFRASVWVDGHALGSHRGSYLPFEARAQLAAGTHTVVVRVDWRDPAAQTREGFHRTWFNWGGLDGEVSVRAIGASELLYPTVQTTLSPDTPDAAQATVRVGVQVRNDGPSPRTIAPTGTLTHEAQTIPVSFAGQTVAPGQTVSMSASVTVEHPALWAPGSPNLYDLTLAVGQESSYSTRVGLRQLSWSGARVCLNGQRLIMHGASLQEDAKGHGDALTPEDENTLVGELKAIGANAVRSQHPLDPALLERLDAAGVLVWQGIGPVEGAGNWYSSTPSLLGEAEQQARTAALAAASHPSVVAWNLVDEVADNGRDAAEVSYVRTMTKWLHAHDPTHMVAVDVWGDHPPARAGALYREVDAVAETDYSGWYDSPGDTQAQLSAMMRSRLAAMQRTFAGKVLVISEFGAESNTLNPAGSPGSYGFQARLLASHIAVYERDPQLSGMLIWDLRDYPLVPTFEGGSIHYKLPRLRLIEGINQKGLFTYGGSPKPAVGVVARLFKALPRV
jgi:Glycosyl hydrolases family 2, TIM barrel domain/Glycosyl hydrolases family 2/Glycosyl hydrolases family 2, sugar binding domain